MRAPLTRTPTAAPLAAPAMTAARDVTGTVAAATWRVTDHDSGAASPRISTATSSIAGDAAAPAAASPPADIAKVPMSRARPGISSTIRAAATAPTE